MQERWIGFRVLLLSLALLLPVTDLLAAGIEVREVSARLQEDRYRLQAKIDYLPRPEVLEALEHGVPLTFEVEINVRRDGAWYWESDLLERRLTYVLRYHALASMYELFLPDHVRPQRFATREAALRALGELSGVELISPQQLEEGENYLVLIGSSLDIDALPVPLRPRAYLSSAWSLYSEKRAWPLRR